MGCLFWLNLAGYWGGAYREGGLLKNSTSKGGVIREGVFNRIITVIHFKAPKPLVYLGYQNLKNRWRVGSYKYFQLYLFWVKCTPFTYKNSLPNNYRVKSLTGVWSTCVMRRRQIDQSFLILNEWIGANYEQSTPKKLAVVSSTESFDDVLIQEWLKTFNWEIIVTN